MSDTNPLDLDTMLDHIKKLGIVPNPQLPRTGFFSAEDYESLLREFHNITPTLSGRPTSKATHPPNNPMQTNTHETPEQPADAGCVRRLVRYLVALRRSLNSYDSDMGGWKERLQWELGYADGEMGIPARITTYDHPYEHGYYCAAH